MSEKSFMLIEVEPQPEYIDSSGRWSWPLKPPHDNGGKCPAVCDASRRWWEYAPDEAKPCPGAEAVYLDLHGDGRTWYWMVEGKPEETSNAEAERLKGLLEVERQTAQQAVARFCSLRNDLRDVEAALKKVASHLGVPDTTPLGLLPEACCEAVDCLKDDLRRAIAAGDAPWSLAGTPGSESPDDKARLAVCLAKVALDQEIIWDLVEWAGQTGSGETTWRSISDDGTEVEVLEYLPLPPSEEGWEQAWRRKTVAR